MRSRRHQEPTAEPTQRPTTTANIENDATIAEQTQLGETVSLIPAPAWISLAAGTILTLLLLLMFYRTIPSPQKRRRRNLYLPDSVCRRGRRLLCPDRQYQPGYNHP